MQATFEFPVMEGITFYRSNSTNIRALPPENGGHAEVLSTEEETFKIELSPKEYTYIYAINHESTPQQFSITYSSATFLRAMVALILAGITLL